MEASRQRCDLCAMNIHEAAIRLTGLCSNDRFEFGRVANRGCNRLHAQGRSCDFEGVQEIFGIWRRYRVEQEGDPGDVRRDLLEQLQPLAGHRRLNAGEAGDVAAWPRKARDEAATDWVG